MSGLGRRSYTIFNCTERCCTALRSSHNFFVKPAASAQTLRSRPDQPLAAAGTRIFLWIACQGGLLLVRPFDGSARKEESRMIPQDGCTCSGIIREWGP
ncbi:hypothetical protein BDV37DRAFT_265576 [Aspergillus pseudonomiae]|uniref:Uncharacterized protein n=1 Tax=Aspergillus pseudonomiae TaxID=1506151 RepID=A0A5N7CTH7_9EURO|nr:uncharacterized protein BDV37DRAFT_265576 [Aspergillus pseudonomiae]KAE8397470.1 hypothetical protein BDV37DRAFT_265576 [Aspergillus pseudonomiae]